ncbi:MAG TPA: ACT domain-containing protein [bacterium]|nr:ACT domain-containing protein [bacterium]HPN29847.1 ACT domain-containing protein [bacterium]
MISITKQLAIFLENKPGVLAKMCGDLAKHNINIIALTVSDTIDHTVLRIIVDKTNEAVHLLETTGAIVIERDVILFELPNKPGALQKVANYLSEKKHNIEYLYCSSGINQKNGTLVLRTKNVVKSFDLLKKLKIK